MGIKYSFVDNAVYGPEDVNEIVGCLTGSGLAPFLSKDSYSTSDLNSVTAALATSGTSLDGCGCTVENSGTVDMCVRVSQGIIFFESGVRLVVDSEGYSISVSPNAAGYIFAHYSPSLQTADIRFEAELPIDGECVELARLSANGQLAGMRSFARSKVGTMGRNVAHTVVLTNQTPVLYEAGETESAYIVAKAEGVPMGDYNYVYIMEGVGDIAYRSSHMGLYNLETQMFPVLMDSGRVGYNYENDPGFFRSTITIYEGRRYFKVIDGELCLVVYAVNQYFNRYGIQTGSYTAMFL